MAQVQPAHACARHHRQVLGQLDAHLVGPQDLPDLELLGVVRTTRVAECRANSAKLLGNQLLVARLLVGRVPGPSHLLVQHLGQRFSQPVGQRLDHDRPVVVVILLVLAHDLIHAQSRRHRERAHVVAQPRLFRRHVVREAKVRLVLGLHLLLPEHAEPRQFPIAALVGVHHDVVAFAVGRPQPIHRVGVDLAARHQFRQHFLGIRE